MGIAGLSLGRMLPQSYFYFNPKYFLDSVIRMALWLRGIMDEKCSGIPETKGSWQESLRKSKGTRERVVKLTVCLRAAFPTSSEHLPPSLSLWMIITGPVCTRE